jgi:cytochrome c oxidase subunit II
MDTTKSILLPPSGSTIAPEVDSLFWFVLIASIIMFVIVLAGVLFFVIRYRRRAEGQLTASISHNTKLEILWTAIPLILVFIVFVWGFRTYLKMRVVPAGAIQIKVTAQKWFWTFDYPEGMNSLNELVVPVDKPIQLTMSSTDVIHSFFVPGFRIKMDVLPNRYTVAWFEATQVGSYDLFCAEYCGTSHSEMIAKVKVVTEREYGEWLNSASLPAEGMSLSDLGAKLYASKACITCHTVDGSAKTGPSFLGRYGRQIKMTDGTQLLMDENYMRESILKPQAKVAAGYQPVMPTYQGLLKDRQIDALIAYIKSIQSNSAR